MVNGTCEQMLNPILLVHSVTGQKCIEGRVLVIFREKKRERERSSNIPQNGKKKEETGNMLRM